MKTTVVKDWDLNCVLLVGRRDWFMALLSVMLITAGLFPATAEAQCVANELSNLDPEPVINQNGYGRTVAISGNVAVVGAPFDSHSGKNGPGSAFVFEFNGVNWVRTAKLFSSTAFNFDGLGNSVSIDGDTIAVGASAEGGLNQGAVYVFERPVGGWTDMVETARLTASLPSPSARLGASVFISGDTVMAGGVVAVCLFEKPAGGWTDMTETSVLIEFLFALAVRSGWISISGDLALIGGESTLFNSTGAVLVLRFDGTNWVEEDTLTASDAASSDRFGTSVSVRGNVAVVGAPREDDGGTDAGAAYVFRFDGTQWVEEAKLVASDAEEVARFGTSVAIDEDVILVGAANHGDTGGFFDDGHGAAYAFRFDGNGWSEAARLVATDTDPADALGSSVALDGELGVIGAPNGPPLSSAYIFDGLSDCNLDGTLDLCEAGGGDGGDCTGNGIRDACEAGSGDMNGDFVVDLQDHSLFVDCMTGLCDPNSCNVPLFEDPCCTPGDGDRDGDIDLRDWSLLQMFAAE